MHEGLSGDLGGAQHHHHDDDGSGGDVDLGGPEESNITMRAMAGISIGMALWLSGYLLVMAWQSPDWHPRFAQVCLAALVLCMVVDISLILLARPAPFKWVAPLLAVAPIVEVGTGILTPLYGFRHEWTSNIGVVAGFFGFFVAPALFGAWVHVLNRHARAKKRRSSRKNAG